MLAGGAHFPSHMERKMSGNHDFLQSDMESLQLSVNFDQYEGNSSRIKKLRALNYNTATGDEGGITNQEESATDNDFEFMSLLRGIGNKKPAPQARRSIICKKESTATLNFADIPENLLETVPEEKN